MRAMRAVPIQHSAPHSNELSRVRAQVPAACCPDEAHANWIGATVSALHHWAASQLTETPLIPAKAGIQRCGLRYCALSPCVLGLVISRDGAPNRLRLIKGNGGQLCPLRPKRWGNRPVSLRIA